MMAGFLHNPEFDTSENRYFASHCTCAWKLHGPQADSQEYLVRPFQKLQQNRLLYRPVNLQ